jgi:phenylacetate-CoA ligase
VVGTYLHNFAMPFIRYQQGDSAALDEAPCACGRTFRGLRGLQGRQLDQFILPSGRVLTSGWLLDASYSFLLDVGADIAEFRLIQEAVDRVRIEVVPGRDYTAAMSDAVRARFLELVAEPIGVQVAVVPEIARAGGGKHHPIVSRVAQATRRK